MIKHNQFRYLTDADNVFKRNIDSYRNAWLFLRDNVIGYTYCYVLFKEEPVYFSMNRNDILHLFGIKYLGKRMRFFLELENKQYIWKNIQIHTDGTTIQKEACISSIYLLFTSLNIYVNSTNEIRLNLEYDKSISTTRKVIKLGLKNMGSVCVPLTLLNLSQEPNERLHGGKANVIAILRKKKGTEHNNETPEIMACSQELKIDTSKYFK